MVTVYVISSWRCAITPVEADRVSEKSVWIKGRRSSRRGGYESFYDTWEEAHKSLTAREADRVRFAEIKLEEAKAAYEKVKEMRED